MICILDTRSKRQRAAKLSAGFAFAAFLVLGSFVASASAQGYRDDHHGGDHRDNHQGWHGNGNANGNGGYYAAPPVVYGGPYYAAPPVVYSPGVAVVVPGVGINIQ
jgi:hypothetical protein